VGKQTRFEWEQGFL